MDEMIVNGQIIEAVTAYCSDDATTEDFDGTATTGKPWKSSHFVRMMPEIKFLNMALNLYKLLKEFNKKRCSPLWNQNCLLILDLKRSLLSAW